MLNATTIDNISQFQPMGDRVVVKPVNIASKQTGAIFIPETAQTSVVDRGIVVSVGPGRINERTLNNEPMNVAIGDKVLMSSKYAAVDLMVGDERYLLVREPEIACIIEEE